MRRDVLYVDDEPENLIVFEAAFEEEFNVLTASSGTEALRMLEQHPVPVVVTDQRMPEMTGAELLEIVRRTHPHTKRIILTGYTETSAMIDAINKGEVFHFVKKPWEEAALRTVLVRAIEAHDLAVTNSALVDRLVVADRCALLGRSAARIAHELGNQLSVLPLLELIEEDYRDDANLVSMAQITRTTYERLASLVEEVKTLVRCEQHTVEMQLHSMAEIVHELLLFLRHDHTVPRDRIVFECQRDVAVRCSRTKIQQVLVNLVKNAAHATAEKADAVIHLRLSAADNCAVLEVRDNGCGIPPENIERIWEPFFTTKGESGTGLGLDVSREIMRDHGGMLECRSVIARGTTFTMRLPASGPRGVANSGSGSSDRSVDLSPSFSTKLDSELLPANC